MMYMERVLNCPSGRRRWVTNDAAWLAAAHRQRRWESIGTLCPALALGAGVYVFVYPTVAPILHNLLAALTFAMPH
jgi:hypothetical protein